MERKEIELRVGMQGKACKLIIFNNMKKPLKREHTITIAQFFSIYVLISNPFVPLDVQRVINNNFKVFVEVPKGLPLT